MLMARGVGHLTLLVALVLGSGVAQAAGYDFASINYPGTASSQTDAFGINANGLVVGTYYDANGIPTGTYSYDSKRATYRLIAAAPGLANQHLTGVNRNGAMVGFANSTTTFLVALIRNPLGTYTSIIHSGAVDTEFRGINDGGSATGFYRTTLQGGGIAFLYNNSGTVTDLVPGLLTPLSCIAQGINTVGQIVGHAYLPPGGAYPGSPLREYGWMRRTSGTYQLFDVNQQRTFGRGINDSAVMVGFTIDGFGTPHGFFTTLMSPADYQSITLSADQILDFPGAVMTFPQAINNDGVIVGNWVDAAGAGHGFIATPTSPTR